MSGYIRLDLNGMRELANNLVTGAQNAMDEINRLASRADPSDVWTDQAAASYKRAFDTWHRAQGEAQKALEQLGRAVTAISDNYQEVSANGTAAFDRFFQ